MPNGKGRDNLRLESMSDLALMHIVDELCDSDPEGWADSRQIGELLNLETDHPAQNVGIRLAHLKKLGVMELKDGGRKWRFTGPGERLFRASLSASQEKAFGQATEEQLLAITQSVSQALVSIPENQRALMRREFTYGLMQSTGIRGALRNTVRGRAA